VLLGGIHAVSGPWAGAALFTWLQDTVARQTDYWRALLGIAMLIGASIAGGDCPGVALLGDGAFLMRATVIPTAVELKLPIVWIVFDNRSLQIERETMFRLYGRESMCDYRKIGEDELWGPDYAAMARAMGAEGVTIDRAEDFKPAFEKAIDSGLPTVISVDTEIETPQYRSIWYPYPHNFNDTWKSGPLEGVDPTQSPPMPGPRS